MIRHLVVCSLLALCTTQPILAAPNFDPSQFQIEQIIQGGPGCPKGSVSAALAPNAAAFSVLYDKFIASVGGSEGTSSANLVCNLKLKLRLPQGYALSIESADFRGFVSLEPGVSAMQKVNFKLGHVGVPLDIDFGTQSWNGPFDGDYVISSAHTSSPSPSAGCAPNNKTMLEIKTHVQLRGGAIDRSGLVTVDSADGRMAQRYRLVWKPCTR